MGRMFNRNISNKLKNQKDITQKVTKCSLKHFNNIKNLINLFFNYSLSSIALVDDRLAGEGTGKVLGINDLVLGWIIVLIFSLVWVGLYVSTKNLGGQSEGMVWDYKLIKQYLFFKI